MRSRASLRAAVLSFLLLPSVRAGADIPPPPDSPETKRVPVAIELDWGVFADRVSRKHVVVAGDTLRSLATKYLGDKEKWKVIADANPALAANPDRIKVGDVLWIPPPQKPPAPVPLAPSDEDVARAILSGWYDGFWQSSARRGPPRFEARATPGELPESFRGGATLVLVPHQNAGPFVAALGSDPTDAPQGSFEGVLYAGLYGNSLVHKDDPTTRIVTRFKVTGAKERALVVETERLRYDAAGGLVTRVWDVPQPSHEYLKPPGEPPLTATTPVPAPPGMEAPSAPDAPPADAPPEPTFAPPSVAPPSGAVPPTPPSVAEPAAPAMAESAPTAQPSTPAAPTGSASIPSTKEGGSGGTKPPIPPLVLVVASLVALALIGVVVALRRGATKAIAATPPPPPTSSAPPPASAPSSDAPAGTTEFPPGSPPPPGSGDDALR